MRRWLGSASLNVCLHIRNGGGGVVRNLFTAQNCAFQNLLPLKGGNNHPFPLKTHKTSLYGKGVWLVGFSSFYTSVLKKKGTICLPWPGEGQDRIGLQQDTRIKGLRNLHL